MNPEENYSLPTISGVDQPKKRTRLFAVIAAVVVVILVVVWIIVSHRGPALSVTGTIPTLKKITTQTPSMVIKFNEPLASGSASVASSPSIVTASSISNDTLKLTLAPKTMLSSKTYTITIRSIRSKSGKKLTNQQFTFKPNFAPPVIKGEDRLLNIGLTNAQIDNINSYVAKFNPWATTLTVDTSSVKHYLEQPNNPWSPWAVSFSASIDGKSYTFVGDFYSTQDIRLTIHDPATNKQVFTAGSPGTI